jgi:NitT/TauT family transport system substrate-binding protein
MATVFKSVVLLLTTLATSVAGDRVVLRVGHFPNVTHVQGLVAHHLSRQGQGWFETRLGPGVKIQWFTYNAGPRASVQAFVTDSQKAGFLKTMPDLSRLFEPL